MRTFLLVGAGSALASAIVFGGAVGAIQQGRINHLETKLELAEVVNDQCKADIDSAAAAWQSYRDAAEKRAAEQNEALKRAETAAEKAEKRAATIARLQPSSGDQCAAAKELLENYIQSRS